jgi:hypothetical protein
MGNIHLARAEPLVAQALQSGILTTTEYAQAKAAVVSSTLEYQAALDLARRNPDAHPVLPIKAQISLANAQRLAGVTQLAEQQLDQAQQAFDRANQMLDVAFAADLSQNPRLLVTAQWIRGSTALGLATIKFQQGDDAAFKAQVQIAQDVFAACARQPANADQTLKRITGQCQQQLDQIKEGMK